MQSSSTLPEHVQAWRESRRLRSAMLPSTFCVIARPWTASGNFAMAALDLAAWWILLRVLGSLPQRGANVGQTLHLPGCALEIPQLPKSSLYH
jgi:hypothetical protein